MFTYRSDQPTLPILTFPPTPTHPTHPPPTRTAQPSIMKFLASLAALAALYSRFAAADDGQVSDYMVAQAWLKPLTVKAGGKVSVTLDFVLLEDDGARGRRLDSYPTAPTQYTVMVRSKESKPGAKGSVSFQDPPPPPAPPCPPPPPHKIFTWPHPPFPMTVYPWRAVLRNVLQQEQDQQVSEREGLRVHQVHPFPQPLQAQVRSEAIVIPLCSAEYPLTFLPPTNPTPEKRLAYEMDGEILKWTVPADDLRINKAYKAVFKVRTLC